MPNDPEADLHAWLCARGLGEYSRILAENAVDLETLFELDYCHLQEMQLPIGVRVRILKATGRQTRRPEEPPASTARVAEPVTERRRVTALFCDVVGYTDLASRLDGEELRRRLLSYWTVVEETVTAYQGYTAQHLGDGALVYFGFPYANEHDGERAIRAALALLAAVPEATRHRDGCFRVRIGIATGMVIINQIGGREGAVETLAIGQTVNLASRLQSLAEPNSILVDETTRRLVGELFDVEPVGVTAIDGIGRAPTWFRVLGERAATSRFEARRFDIAGDILGREHEIAAASALWKLAADGAGQVLLLQGEPGIGKSRLAREIVDRVAADGRETVFLQCSHHHENSPFYPLIACLTRLAGTDRPGTPDERLDRFEAAFGAPGKSRRGDWAILAELMNLDGSGRFGPVPARAEEQRTRAMTILVDLLVRRAEAQPFLLLIEDLHWCDPTTLEFLDLFMQRALKLPILIAITVRPEFHHNFHPSLNVSEMRLSRLNRMQIETLARRLFRSAEIPTRLVDFITSRTDGVPLFIEELSRNLQESGSIRRCDGELVFEGSNEAAAVPDTLHGILMGRLDRLGSSKKIAQVAACIGRDFDLEILGKIVDQTPSMLSEALDHLCASQLVFSRGQAPQTRFSFKHALVRDVAYDSLLVAERRKIHDAIAVVLEDAEVDGRGILHEVLAHHQMNADRTEAAIRSWRSAALAAKLHSADDEAIAHLRNALHLLDRLPPEVDRDPVELSLLLELVAPYRSSRGFAAPEVAAVTDRALHLADRAKDFRAIIPLLYNQWVFKFVTAHRDVCATFAERILSRCEDGENAQLRMTGLRARAATQFTRGDFRQAVENFDASLDLYSLGLQSELTRIVGLDAKVAALGYKSMACWCLGNRDDALEAIALAIAHAETVAHAGTTSFAIYHDALLRGVLEGDAEVLLANGRQLGAFGRDHHFRMWAVCGELLESLAECAMAPSTERLSLAESLFREFEDMGLVYRPAYEVFIARMCCVLQERQKGLAHIVSAKNLMSRSGERWSESEVHRLEGDLRRLHPAEPAMADACYRLALETARRQGAREFVARASDALADLSGGGHRGGEAMAGVRRG